MRIISKVELSGVHRNTMQTQCKTQRNLAHLPVHVQVSLGRLGGARHLVQQAAPQRVRDPGRGRVAVVGVTGAGLACFMYTWETLYKEYYLWGKGKL
jgi:hypothetical protein